MSELRKWMIREMQLRNFSPETQRSYLNSVTGLAKYYRRSPDVISPAEIQDYVIYLLTERIDATKHEHRPRMLCCLFALLSYYCPIFRVTNSVKIVCE